MQNDRCITELGHTDSRSRRSSQVSGDGTIIRSCHNVLDQSRSVQKYLHGFLEHQTYRASLPLAWTDANQSTPAVSTFGLLEEKSQLWRGWLSPLQFVSNHKTFLQPSGIHMLVCPSSTLLGFVIAASSLRTSRSPRRRSRPQSSRSSS